MQKNSLLFFLISFLFSLSLFANKSDETNTIGYKLFGSGSEKVLVMHNWFSDCTCYEPIITYLDPHQFTYLFMDLRGYGLSKDFSGDYTVDEAAKDALNLIDILQWEQFHIIGHSMSGMVAQKIASLAPSCVKGIVAITPIPACGSPKSSELMTFLQEAALFNEENALYCVNMLTSNRYAHLFAKEIIYNWRSSSTPEARIGYLDMFSNTDFSSDARGLLTPMLVIFGQYDIEGEKECIESTFLDLYPNAEPKCCEGAGHFPMQETPVFLASMIENFFRCLKS